MVGGAFVLGTLDLDETGGDPLLPLLFSVRALAGPALGAGSSSYEYVS